MKNSLCILHNAEGKYYEHNILKQIILLPYKLAYRLNLQRVCDIRLY